MLKLFTCSFWPSCGYHIREELVEDSSSRLECLQCWAGCLVATGAYLTAVICSHFKHIHNSSTFLLVLDAPSKKKTAPSLFLAYVTLQKWNFSLMCSSKLKGRPLSCRLSDKVCFWITTNWVGTIPYSLLTFNIMLKANDQLYRWFEDDDALEEAMGGEYALCFF